MALSSVLRSLLDRVTTNRGGGYLFPASGLSRDLQKIQAGEVHLAGANEVIATGWFKYNYPINEIPRIMICPTCDSSGNLWVSASGEDHFVVTFENTPLGDDIGGVNAVDLVPYLVCTYLAII